LRTVSVRSGIGTGEEADLYGLVSLTSSIHPGELTVMLLDKLLIVELTTSA
jgi:hypothetical protein